MRRFLAFSIAVVCGINGALAAEPESARVAPTEREITDYEREHWTFQPLADVAVPQVGAQGSEHPVDRFLQALQSERGIDPLPAVSRATLLRRVSFDLTGLPPTPQEVQTFLADSAPDAYEKVVDRLLASTAYGERWAQHWLDLARFAETDGFEFDAIRPHAWRYRDWVIDALNRDLPFDEFVRMQIAGDELSDSPQGAIATGFLLCGPDMPDLNLQEERRHQVLNEMTATVGAVFLGLQMGCAQCHDHKYDPISQYDFYRLRAYFESANLFRDHPIPSIDEAEARRAAEAVWTREDHDRAKRRRELEETARKRFREKNPDERPEFEQLMAELSNEERADYTAIHERLKSLPALPELPLGRVIKEGEPRAGHYYARGDFRQPGPEVPCDVPRVLRATRVDADHPPKSPRVALARWLTGREQPLAARVLVNRIWQWHFGAGLCAAPSDFGLTASEPIQRQLLDWLAQHFINAGGSLKRLHRLLVTSRFYQRASSVYDAGWSADASLVLPDAEIPTVEDLEEMLDDS